MKTQFFLGANSGRGFYSLYDEFAKDSGDFLYLIKGGPGCGKSGFMRKISDAARRRGLNTVEILCSGDPDSLDGVYIPKLRLGFCDATAPHAEEPGIFAHDSCYVNLGYFCRRAESNMLSEYSAKYKSMYKAAYSYLASAAELKKAPIPGLFNEDAIELSKKRARSAASREARGHGDGKLSRRFISCIGCRGKLCLNDTVSVLCKRIYIVDDLCGLARYYLDEYAASMVKHGNNVILCPDPLLPEVTAAVLIPDTGIACISSSVDFTGKPYRHIKLDGYADIIAHRSELKARQRLSAELQDIAVGYFAKAKEHHDLLEAEYRPYIDFDALTAYTDSFIEGLFK